MILMFNKTNYEGKWFKNWECNQADDTTGYTEKVPPNTNYCWNEELNEWVLKPSVTEEPELEESEPEENLTPEHETISEEE